ncbi:hypothetical protein BDA96_06G251200 [Sorghum bicolor]|uniref:Uncharacterized protein n=2 Tax=Sorghum bicolor TaxID=4558 RepID=A0A921QSG4_SORBI|nr:hypothetical protein BDA96_06G251200 [Sorghum bicolor]OQU82399.1 hypothetical protein SORBI_3006G229250 [Sorghum bicolor]
MTRPREPPSRLVPPRPRATICCICNVIRAVSLLVNTAYTTLPIAVVQGRHPSSDESCSIDLFGQNQHYITLFFSRNKLASIHLRPSNCPSPTGLHFFGPDRRCFGPSSAVAFQLVNVPSSNLQCAVC